jgi:hypothetical protein
MRHQSDTSPSAAWRGTICVRGKDRPPMVLEGNEGDKGLPTVLTPNENVYHFS